MRLPKATRKTGVVFFPAFDWAISPNHPERQERLLYTRDQIFEEGLFDVEGITEFSFDIAKKEDVARVHGVFPGISNHFSASHQAAAGGVIAAARAVMDKTVEKAFALVRPPGHHAMRIVRGLRGFCVVNTEAMMVEHLRRHYGPLRVAIVDTDCHHGDGTQDIYWNDPDTLFISLHQDGRTLYPGTGFPSEFGGPNAYGTTLNIPMPPGTSDEGYLTVMDEFVLPVLEDWQPDLIINSAGQDNHFTDPITNMKVTARGYAEITRKLNPHVAVLEGGYSVQSALPYVNTAILLAMAGLSTAKVIEPDYHPGIDRMGEKELDYLKKISELMLARYQNRKELAEKQFGGRDWVETERSVYHDESGINEDQIERVRLCRDCAGLVTLLGEVNGRRDSLFMITVPRDACRACRDEGTRIYEETDRSTYDVTLLQMRPDDTVKKKGKRVAIGAI